MKSNVLEQTRERTKYFRIAIYLVAMFGLMGLLQNRGQRLQAQAPAEKLEESAAPSSSTASSSATANEPPTLWKMYVACGIIGYIITLLSMIGLGFIVEHALTIRKETIMPDHVVSELNNLLHHGQLD